MPELPVFENKAHLEEALVGMGYYTELWGGEEADGVQDLWNEIENEEVQLLPYAHRLLRVISVAKIDLFGLGPDWKQLKITAQDIPGKGLLPYEKPRSMSEKMRKGESPQDAAARGVAEELAKCIEPDSFELFDTYNNRNISARYVGMDTRATIHRLRAAVPPSFSVAHQESFWAQDKSGIAHEFDWFPLDEMQPHFLRDAAW